MPKVLGAVGCVVALIGLVVSFLPNQSKVALIIALVGSSLYLLGWRAAARRHDGGHAMRPEPKQ